MYPTVVPGIWQKQWFLAHGGTAREIDFDWSDSVPGWKTRQCFCLIDMQCFLMMDTTMLPPWSNRHNNVSSMGWCWWTLHCFLHRLKDTTMFPPWADGYYKCFLYVLMDTAMVPLDCNYSWLFADSLDSDLLSERMPLPCLLPLLHWQPQ
jgi:hypothetical protein